MTTTTTVSIILAAAVATYFTRVGGYILISRLKLYPRAAAALNAVPAAVLTTLVAPSFVNAGFAELAALMTSALVSLRAGMLSTFFAGAAVLLLLRNFSGG